MTRITLILIATIFATTVNAQSVCELETMYLGSSNHVTLNIPPKLADRMVALTSTVTTSTAAAIDDSNENAVAQPSPEQHETVATAKTGGYRVQVFLDNNARTAKNEARARARNISEQFPNLPTYVVYSSPYWRLRVGNFRSHEEADAAASELSAAFPAYAREIRVVRDRIVVSPN